ncbi:YopX family protein [Prevotella pallens]|uniref:YopX family protein n=1 Tax=Prevotella pallens TaxID=60133 RepID=UPI0023F49508|nr:YopX family protein [Prevotella pallens]
MTMRDIKFRIWDGAKNEWLASSSKDALPYYGFALVGEVMTVQSLPYWSLDEGNIVEQFTGLKDINGAEIFEGDIIFQKPLSKNSIGWVGKIIFKQGAFMAEVYERGKIVMYLFLSEFNAEKTSEVIGNIHENPELLEKK